MSENNNPEMKVKSPEGDQLEDRYDARTAQYLRARQNIPEYIGHEDLVKICPACHRQSLMRDADTGVWACIAAPACTYSDDQAMT